MLDFHWIKAMLFFNKYYTIGTVQKSRKSKNTALLEKFKNLEKQKIPHYWNSSKI
jgi:hypothetical protein